MELRLDRITKRALENTGAPSLSVAATLDGEVCYVKAVGAATENSAYNIASVTKQFTAACVLLLVRSGAIALEQTIDAWFPELTRADDITVRNLLSHTSGYPDYYPLGYPDEEKLHNTDPAEIVRRYATLPLQFEPGSAWSYSNTGYHIAGLIVERVSRRPFGEFLTENILRPAGMRESFFNDPPRTTAASVGGFTRYCFGPLARSGGERSGWAYAAGGIASTAHDLALWHAILMKGELLTREEVATMTRPMVLKQNAGPSVPALGWFAELRGPHAVVQHSGGLAGFTSQTILSLDRRGSVVVLSNGDHVQAGAIANEMFEVLLPDAEAPPPEKNDVPPHAPTTTRLWLERFANGAVPPAELTAELTAYLTRARLADARSGLAAQGALNRVEIVAAGERGGMRWHKARAEFANGNADVLMRETLQGKLAEFNAYPVP